MTGFDSVNYHFEVLRFGMAAVPVTHRCKAEMPTHLDSSPTLRVLPQALVCASLR